MAPRDHDPHGARSSSSAVRRGAPGRADADEPQFLGYFVELAEELLLRDERGLGSWPCKLRR